MSVEEAGVRSPQGGGGRRGLRRLGLWSNLLLGGLLALIVWAMLVWVASRPALKSLIDLTPQQLNTVGPVTKQLLGELRDEQVKIEFHVFTVDTRGMGQNDFQRSLLRIRSRLVTLTEQLLRSYEYLGAESVVVIPHSPYGNSAEYREAAQAFG